MLVGYRSHTHIAVSHSSHAAKTSFACQKAIQATT